MTDILGLGELLVDFTPDGVNDQGMARYARNPGGSIPNMLAMYAKMGGSAAFVGKVGRDAFGDFLISQLEKAGVDASGVLRDDRVPTTLAIVNLLENGDRSFHFYRKPGADILLREAELPLARIRAARRFHFAGVSLTDEPARSATFAAVRLARNSSAFISFDCNHRASLWDDQQEARSILLSALPLADIVKLSEEELFLLQDCGDLTSGAQAVLDMGPQAVLISRGEKGACVFTPQCFCERPAYAVQVVDTTGCGDAFLGALLYELYRLDKPLDSLGEDAWGRLLAYGNAAGSLTATRRGGIPALPEREAVERLASGV